MIVSKEWDSVCHHPDVPSPAIIVGFVPFTILIANCKNLFLFHGNITVIDDLLMKTLNHFHVKLGLFKLK